MANKQQKLEFVISLLDKLSAPLGKMQGKFDKSMAHMKRGAKATAAGLALIATSAFGVVNALEPAHATAQKLGEVKSLGVAADELQRLEKQAYLSATEFGTSSQAFIGAAYDIQSSISGLKPGQLATVTASMNTLAMGTKADVADMTNYMGTLYGIFENSAVKMGVGKFSQQVAAFTAKSVQAFKTTGKAMGDAFSRVGSLAKTHGIGMAEQFAVMGTLQATMPGAEAGTKYKAFLSGVMKAQDKLGMKFTDSKGKMLPMVQVLEKIKAKYGELDSVEIAQLKKGFGSDQAIAVVTDLLPKIDKLKGSVNDIGNADYSLVNKMANDIADPWAKVSNGINAISSKVGGNVLPLFNKAADKFAELVKTGMQWMDDNPKLAKTLSYVAYGVFGLVAGLGALLLIAGLASMALGGVGIVLAVLTSPITLVIAAVGALAAGAYYLYTQWDSLKASLSQSAWGQTLLSIIDIATAPIRGLWEVMKTLYNHWDQVKIALSDSLWGQVLVAVIEAVTAPFRFVVGLFSEAKGSWDGVKASFSDTAWGDAIIGVLNGIKAPLDFVLGGLSKAKGFIGSKWQAFKDKAGISRAENLSHGGGRAKGGAVTAGHYYKVNEHMPELLSHGGQSYLMVGQRDQNATVTPLVKQRQSNLGSVINNNSQSSQSRTIHIGKIELSCNDMDANAFIKELEILSGA